MENKGLQSRKQHFQPLAAQTLNTSVSVPNNQMKEEHILRSSVSRLPSFLQALQSYSKVPPVRRQWNTLENLLRGVSLTHPDSRYANLVMSAITPSSEKSWLHISQMSLSINVTSRQEVNLKKLRSLKLKAVYAVGWSRKAANLLSQKAHRVFLSSSFVPLYGCDQTSLNHQYSEQLKSVILNSL